MSSDHLSNIQHIRQRPSMYVGTTSGIFGVIHYLVDATNLVLQHSPSFMEITSSNGRFSIGSDITLPIHENENGELFPFECFRREGNPKIGYGLLVTALSDQLLYSQYTDGIHVQYAYRKGVRSSSKLENCPAGFQSYIEFAPDPSIFELPPISDYNLNSYLNRLRYFHPSTRFCFSQNGTRHVYHAENGIEDMFVAFASPYQLMHEPVRIRTTSDAFSLEFIFALHSWKNNVCCAFVNKGRAVEGGTHKQGLDRALEHLQKEVFSTGNGIVGLLSIHHSDVEWHGCIKAKIGNPELDPLVFDAIVDGTKAWIADRPQLRKQIQCVQTFQFPDVWFE